MSSRTDFSSAPAASADVRAAGKFLRAGDAKICLKGVSYGPFAPNDRGEPYPGDAQLRRDLAHIRELGFNAVRLYELPTPSILALAAELGLRLIVNIPWTDHVDFLRSPSARRDIETAVAQAVTTLKDHFCIAAFLVGHELEKTLVRWMGPLRVRCFLERLIALGRSIAPNKLFSYSTYPSTEYLAPRNADFLAVNVYLENPRALANYLQRLQNLAGNKPLVIAEFGLDVAHHGEAAQANAVVWAAQAMGDAGVAGGVWFSYTDEWVRGGVPVLDWQFGLVTASRVPRSSCAVLPSLSVDCPRQTGSAPRFSVIVCTRNGSATLASCLQSITRLRYPDFEALVIDDGSTEDIAAIVRQHPQIRHHRLEHAGLSVARNTGSDLATGDILAFTDDDCLVDEDWLTYLAPAFEELRCVAAGGPNIPPPPRNRVEAVVAAAPGAPSHVLLNDAEAEHLPGCNLAIRREALVQVGGFRPAFTTAGDDVDICWRLRAAGGRLRFVPGAMVWHRRRFSVRAYLRQQRGYGAAEALLIREHPQHFGIVGGARWSGAIYGGSAPGSLPEEGAIFHGPLGYGLFQSIYAQGVTGWLDRLGGTAWMLPSLICFLLGLWAVGLALAAWSFLLAVGRLRRLPTSPFDLSPKDNLLLLFLCWSQPIVREFARLLGMIRLRALPSCRPNLTEVFTPHRPRKWTLRLDDFTFWSETGVTRDHWLRAFQDLLATEALPFRLDDGWRWFDVEVNPDGLVSPAVISVTEHHHAQGRLTRIRLLVRVRRWLFASLAGTVILLSVLLAPQPRTLILTMLGALCLIGTSAILQRAAIRRWILRAAKDCGLEIVNHRS